MSWCQICCNGIFCKKGHVLESCYVCSQRKICKFNHFIHYCSFCENYDICKNTHRLIYENGILIGCQSIELDVCDACGKRFYGNCTSEHTPVHECESCWEWISECGMRDHYYSSCPLCRNPMACRNLHNVLCCSRCGLRRCIGREESRSPDHPNTECSECGEGIYICDLSQRNHFYSVCPLCRRPDACTRKHNIPICNLCSTKGCRGKSVIDPKFFQSFQCKRCRQPVYGCCMGAHEYPYCPRCDEC